MCLPDLNMCNTTAEEEYRLNRSIRVFAEDCLNEIDRLQTKYEELQALKVNVKRSVEWLKEYIKVIGDVSQGEKNMLQTILTTLED